MLENSIKYLDILTEHRRALHMIPEAAFAEEKTTKYVCDVLDSLGVPYKRILPTAVVARIDVCADKTFAFRADIDALPVTESTGRDFSSTHEGFMHACGHDAHAAVLLTFAKYLTDNREKLTKNAVLVFQPAEEGMGGSIKMIEAGALDAISADEIYSFHVSPIYPSGKIYVSSGAAMSCDFAFDIKVHGKSSHAAIPQDGHDAIYAASQLIVMLQSIISRENDPSEHLVLTVGTFNAGTKRNVVADEAHLECSIRSHSEDVASAAYESVLRICEGVSKSFKVDIECDIHHFYGPVMNDERCVSRLEACFDDGEVVRVPTLAVAEDFFAFTKAIPGTMFLCGVKDESCGFVHPLHSDKFDLNEDALLYALESYIRLIND